MSVNVETPVVDRHGHKLHLHSDRDWVSRCLRRQRVWEPFETNVIMSQVTEGDTVVDLGANIGYFTLLLAKLVGPRGKVFAFEPNPHNFELLQQNVAANGYRNVTLVQKAVSNYTGQARLYISEDDPGDHRIYVSDADRQPIAIESMKLDDFFKGNRQRVDLIKMDIQGAEGAAIEGMRLLLENNEALKILFEFWPAGLSGCGSAPEKCLELLMNQGFVFYEIDKTRIERTDIATLLKRYPVESRQFTNVFCCRHRWEWGEAHMEKMSKTWWEPLLQASEELKCAIPPGSSVLVVDNNQWAIDDILRDRRVIPFLERDGEYWGPPADDEVGIRELERLRKDGASFIAFGWPAFWWLDAYPELHGYLNRKFQCVSKNERTIVFDLRVEKDQQPTAVVPPDITRPNDAAHWEKVCLTPVKAVSKLSSAVAQAVGELTDVGDVLLEAGCGSGRLSAELATAGRVIELCDFSQSILDRAKKVFEISGLAPPRLTLCDLTKPLPWLDGAVDAAWSSGVLEHWTDDELVPIVTEMARISRKCVISLVPYAGCVFYRLGKYLAESSGQWPYGREIPRRSLRDVFERAGLGSIREYTIWNEWGPHMLGLTDRKLEQLVLRWWDSLPSDDAAKKDQGYLLLTVGMCS